VDLVLQSYTISVSIGFAMSILDTETSFLNKFFANSNGGGLSHSRAVLIGVIETPTHCFRFQRELRDSGDSPLTHFFRLKRELRDSGDSPFKKIRT
jgi:hypothetical protein